MKKEELYEFVKHSNQIENVCSEEEIVNSLAAWDYLKTKRKLTKTVILGVHKRIAKELNPGIAGKFRKCRVFVGGREGIAHKKISAALNKWLSKYEGKLLSMDAVKRAHIEFEHLHVFEDFNGRTGRLLMLWHQVKSGLPFEMIKYEDRYRYYEWF